MEPQYERASFVVLLDWHKFLMKDKLRFNAYYKYHTRHDVGVDHFETQTLLGYGSFGCVFLVKEIATGSMYAMKRMNKRKLVATGHVNHALNEKRLLQAVNCPFIISLQYFFADDTYIYCVLPYISCGELTDLIQLKHILNEPLSRFYAAQMVLALEYLHFMKVAYRDIKPENILIDVTGYIRLTDFSYAKMINERTYTFCGTPEYLAPEIIQNRGYGYAVDWWAFGILIYEMNHGSTPFRHWDNIILYDKIVNGKFILPDGFSDSLKDIVSRLIQVNLSRRIGNLKRGVEDIKNHRWFRPIVWLSIWNRSVVPPYKPHVREPKDNVDACPTDNNLDDQACDISIDYIEQQFNNF